MACLIKISDFKKRVYGDEKNGATPPTNQTIRNQCKAGILPAEKKGDLWFVDFEAYQIQTGDVLVDQVLRGK